MTGCKNARKCDKIRTLLYIISAFYIVKSSEKRMKYLNIYSEECTAW